MFTGLIEEMGVLEGRQARGSGARLRVACPAWTGHYTPGESIAVEGVCLTAAAFDGAAFQCDVLEETLARTTLGRLPPGRAVNLERALRPDGRLGGHFVTGHVDGLGEITAIRRAGPDWVLAVAAEPARMDEIVFKGSVAVNGVSLTVAQRNSDGFEIHLIPHTWSHTSLHLLKTGDRVNLESDLLGKYVRGFLGKPGAGRVTWDGLASAGFT